MQVAEMEMGEVVALVNEWGTVPRAAEGRTGPDEWTPLADELHAIFAAQDDATRARLVTAQLHISRVRPELSPASCGLTASWVVSDPAQSRRAAAALALRAHLTGHPHRLGVCADTQCADVYVDTSPAGKRRFCCLTCQNRARSAAYRRRHATTG